ncbi:NnrS family protein [Pseudoalteromonas mariniglutinosa]|uniref:NnrS family protein n=1 Tax=Pseudoalteromonas mariniglutinosa TaxID=206042 RepID=UPI0038515A8C
MRPINLTEPMPEHVKFYQFSQWPLWMLAFRPYFLAGALLAVFSIVYWLLILTGYVSWELTMPATLWHAHEMMFGFAGAVAVGFLLTAAQTWTGVASISGRKLMLLTLFWLAARGAFFITGTGLMNFNIYAVMGLQLVWWLGAIAALGKMLLSSKNKNNYQFLFILGGLCALNMIYLGLVSQQNTPLAVTIVDTAVLVMTLLVGVIAGRVVPFFTARGLNLSAQVRTFRLDRILFYSSMVTIVGYFLSQLFIPTINPGWAFASVAGLHLCRSYFWWHSKVLKVPLLWSLHVSYLALGVGLLLLAVSFYSAAILFQDALHMITIGTIGMMILAMMTRVSLGHTGRPLTIPYYMVLAFSLLLVAALVRSLLPFVIGPHIAWQLSAVLWIVAFLLFLFHSIPILTRRRVDGRRG